MTGQAILLSGSTLGLIVMGQVGSVLKQGETLAGMTTAGILGVIALGSIGALVYMFKQLMKVQSERNEEFKTVVLANSEALQGVKDVISECHKKE